MKYLALFTLAIVSCSTQQTPPVRIITLDPGHFHAALVQKTMVPGVDSLVRVYAPEGNDLSLHLGRIQAFNERPENPTFWKEEIHSGSDFYAQFLNEKPGAVVVLSGKNRDKAYYILQSIKAGHHVLADKPMAISALDLEKIKKSFSLASTQKLVLYDIMTERFEVTNQLQRALSKIPEVFGTLTTGTQETPAVVKESVHHFYKNVSGKPLVRPAWFMDVRQQGQGIVDVTTHLVDLVQWAAFPDQILNVGDVSIQSAVRSSTPMTLPEFAAITLLENWPDSLKKVVQNDTLLISSNGVIDYTLKGIHARVSVTWHYRAPEGGGDTHYSIMRGTLANLIIRQGAEQGYKPVLYIEPAEPNLAEEAVQKGISSLTSQFPGITLKKETIGWSIDVPSALHDGHEAHFGKVMERFMEYVRNQNMPDWEVPNMIVKYYTTTKALELSRRN